MFDDVVRSGPTQMLLWFKVVWIETCTGAVY